MLLPSNSEPKLPKCFFTHCELPDYVDGHRPPTKRQPFVAINNHPTAHTVDMILPEELYVIITEKLESDAAILRYARVYMSLLDVVSGDFFNQYIKAGNVAMLSEGRFGIDNLFSLRDGQLRLELDKATYERCGLVGKIMTDQGRTHIKSRYCVEVDLRLPSMLHGKKGFDRIVYAFKNVLVNSLAWVFVDLEHKDINSGPIAKFHPVVYDVRPQITKLINIVVPIINHADVISDSLYEEQLLEWIGLVNINSPRIRSDDTIDRYLCRYDLPEALDTDDTSEREPQNLVHLRWHGFAHSTFILKNWLTPKAALREKWFAMSVSGFDERAYTILCSGGRNVLLWECG
ncbi:hypothetical protein EJ08DRAFT_697272 [Tothia fuscella]|uniref:Uncharacterized protein n=1 Tax=Tothia fuscella TaxID=1048955 RepID=A0A9P4NSB0_9PEZI|nr:hypothetical protein EJ08DRAFT_697272 [Tothia fuscella]